jgi:hypothetical protein
MEVLTKGTKEFIVCPITDTMGNLTVIPPPALYDIYTGDEAKTPILIGGTAVIDGMRILPLIDTTLTLMVVGVYDLFVTFQALPEIPRLGPFRFRVDN